MTISPRAGMGFCSRHIVVALLLILISGPAVHAQDIPPLSDRVVDTAGILPADVKSAMIAQLAAFEAKSSDQVVVATIDTTGDWTIERYANEMFREWGLGQVEENNGVLLLVAVDDRKLRIEVGYGLEGVLTDAIASLIINDTIVPEFRADDYPGGIQKGVNDIIAVLEGDAAGLMQRAQRHENSGSQPDYFAYAFFALFFLIFGGTIIFTILARIFGKKLGPGRYKWLGMEVDTNSSGSSSGSSGWSSGSSGGFSGGGGSSGGGGASGGW